jgi:CBS domain-containing protein
MRAPLERLGPRPPIVVAPETKVSYAVAKLCERRIGCVLVGTEEEAVGIFSERDVLLRVAHRWADVAHRPVRRFMTPDPEMLDASTPIAYALNRMATGDYRHVPVTRDGRLDGIVSLRNVLAFLAEWFPDLIPPG